MSECTKIQLSFPAGKELLNNTEVAGVDCIYDEPTPFPCIVNPDIDPSDSCSSKGQSTADKSKAASQDPASIVLGVLVGILLITVFILLATSIMLR